MKKSEGGGSVMPGDGKIQLRLCEFVPSKAFVAAHQSGKGYTAIFNNLEPIILHCRKIIHR